MQQLERILESQDDLKNAVHTAVSQQYALPPSSTQVPLFPVQDYEWQNNRGSDHLHLGADLAVSRDPESSSPAASASVAAARWFDLLATEVSKDVVQETDLPSGHETGFPDLFSGQSDADLTPLQKATRIVDNPQDDIVGKDGGQGTWQAAGSIALLPQEQELFKNFLHAICPWVGNVMTYVNA